jgi:hypothetical protein
MFPHNARGRDQAIIHAGHVIGARRWSRRNSPAAVTATNAAAAISHAVVEGTTQNVPLAAHHLRLWAERGHHTGREEGDPDREVSE